MKILSIMKKCNNLLRLYRVILLLPFTLFIGCNDYVDNINTDPNNPATVPASVLLSNGLIGSAFSNANDLNRFASTIMDYNFGAAGSPSGWDLYNTTGSDFGNQWRFEIYGGALVSYKRLIENSEVAEPGGSRIYMGIGKIMTAYTFSIATDVWGDVPYSQALLGTENIQPRIDKQEDIYKGNAALGIKSLFTLVREGIADLNTTTTQVFAPGAIDDVVYGGSAANWRRAGYTLMLKMALQISDREPVLAASIINEVIVANEYISTNAQNLSVKFGGSPGSRSPVYTWSNISESSFATDANVSTGYLDLLSGTVSAASPLAPGSPFAGVLDPRRDLFIKRVGAGFTTYQNGFIGTLASGANRSRWSDVVLGLNGVGPVRLITNAMRAFILAEAGLRIPGVVLPGGQTPQTLYQQGITASMTEAGVPAATITAYLATPAGTLTGTPAQQLEQIITQKYIAMTGNGLEAWNDRRRTGYPNFPEHLNAVGIDGRRPRRAQYINEEVQRNPAFTPFKRSNELVWWDVN
jgi:Starch-binding associating with outer membrane